MQSSIKDLSKEIESLLSKLHDDQCEKARKVARMKRPELTREDLHNLSDERAGYLLFLINQGAKNTSCAK